jgi:hypothetical protein
MKKKKRKKNRSRKNCTFYNEFDKKLRSHLNFSDSECFKMMILPLGLEELRAVV